MEAAVTGSLGRLPTQDLPGAEGQTIIQPTQTQSVVSLERPGTEPKAQAPKPRLPATATAMTGALGRLPTQTLPGGEAATTIRATGRNCLAPRSQVAKAKQAAMMTATTGAIGREPTVTRLPSQALPGGSRRRRTHLRSIRVSSETPFHQRQLEGSHRVRASLSSPPKSKQDNGATQKTVVEPWRQSSVGKERTVRPSLIGSGWIRSTRKEQRNGLPSWRSVCRVRREEKKDKYTNSAS